MRARRCALSAALAAILLGACTASSAAYTLNNGGSPLAILIPNGTTFTMASVNPVTFRGGALNDSCTSSTLAGVVADNGSTGNPITLRFTAATYAGCTYPTVADVLPWSFRIAQDGAPWTGNDQIGATIAYGGASCIYVGSGSAEWGNRAATRPLIELAGGSLFTLVSGCPASVVPAGIYVLTSVDYMLASEMKIS